MSGFFPSRQQITNALIHLLTRAAWSSHLMFSYNNGMVHIAQMWYYQRKCHIKGQNRIYLLRKGSKYEWYKILIQTRIITSFDPRREKKSVFRMFNHWPVHVSTAISSVTNMITYFCICLWHDVGCYIQRTFDHCHHTLTLSLKCWCFDLDILKDFENASPRLNPLFHKPWERQRDNCYCIS